jgi:hypothetical protein
MYPPTSVSYGSYWTGANNISIGAGNDYVNVTVQQTDPNLYHVMATGVALDANGATRAKKQITADVLAPLTGKWQVPYAFFSTGTVAFPSSVQLYGDAHSNGSLSGTGWTQSKLSANVAATWLGTGPPSSITPLAPRYTPSPSATTTYYSTYTIQGKSYTAYTGFTDNHLDQAHAVALNALNMGATNPGRIILVTNAPFKINNNVQLNGTLVVAGDIQLDDDGNTAPGIVFTPVTNFPGLVVQGNLQVTHDGATTTVNGSVICGGQIKDNSKKNVKFDVIGACIVATGFSLTGTGGRWRFYWNQANSTFWDFQGAVSPQPVTILNWLEN